MVSIRIAVENMEKSIKFYKEALGYRETTPERDSVKVAWEDEQIRLEELKSFEKNFPEFRELGKSQRGVGVTISLHVQDAEQAYSKIESNGGKIVSLLTVTPSRDRIFTCRDPDNYLLRVHTHTAGHGHPH